MEDVTGIMFYNNFEAIKCEQNFQSDCFLPGCLKSMTYVKHKHSKCCSWFSCNESETLIFIYICIYIFTYSYCESEEKMSVEGKRMPSAKILNIGNLLVNWKN